MSFRSSFSRLRLESEHLLDWSWATISSVLGSKERELNFIKTQIEEIKAELKAIALPKQAPTY